MSTKQTSQDVSGEELTREFLRHLADCRHQEDSKLVNRITGDILALVIQQKRRELGVKNG